MVLLILFKRNNFYQSKKWIRLRKWAISFYGRKCHKCGSIDDIQVDHIIPRSKSYWLRLSKRNCQILCASCNKAKATKTADYRPMWAKVRFHWRYTMKQIMVGFILGCAFWYFIAAGTSPAYWISEAQYRLSQLHEMSSEAL